MNTRTTPSPARSHRRRVAAALLTAVALVAAACGDDADDEAESPATEAPAPETTTTAAAAPETTAVPEPEESGPATTAEPTTSPTEPTTPATTAPAGMSDAEWEAIETAAKEEGRVVWYGPNAPQAAEAIKAAFEAEYPEITVEFTRLVAGPLTEALEAERTTGIDGADFVGLVDPPTVAAMNDNGYLSPILSPAFADLSNTVFAENPLFVQVPNSVIFGGEAHFIIWNTDLVSEPISDYQDLIDRSDEFGGRSLGVPDLTSLPTSAVWTQVEEQFSDIDLKKILVDGEGDTTDMQFMQAIAALDPSYYEGAVPIAQAVAAGEVKAGIMVAGILLKGLKDSGAPVDGVVSSTAPSSVSIVGAIPNWSKRQNASQVFVNWLLSPAGQEAANGAGSVAILDDIPGTVADPVVLNPNRLELLTPEYKEAFVSAFDQIFAR